MESRPQPQRGSRKTKRFHVALLFDVEHTLLDIDQVATDLRRHLEREVGLTCQQQYGTIVEHLRTELGYADSLGSLQRFQIDHVHDHNLFPISPCRMNYPFANRLCPNSREVVARCRAWGTLVILLDGEVVFQPRKTERSGLDKAVKKTVLIYVHKQQELDEVELR